MEQKQIEEALKDLDMSDIAFKLSQLALKAISGKEIKEKTYSVPLSVPEELAEIFELLSEKSGVPTEEMLGLLAKQSYQTALKQTIRQNQQQNQPVTPPTPEQIQQSTGFDMSGLTKQMANVQKVMAQLQEIQKVVQNADQGEIEKNPQQPDISAHEVPCSTSGKK